MLTEDSDRKHGFAYDAKTGVSSCRCGYEAGLRVPLAEHIAVNEIVADIYENIESLKSAVYPNRQYGKGWIDACDHIQHYFLCDEKVKSK